MKLVRACKILFHFSAFQSFESLPEAAYYLYPYPTRT